jgi:hypothetical protein
LVPFVDALVSDEIPALPPLPTVTVYAVPAAIVIVPTPTPPPPPPPEEELVVVVLVKDRSFWIVTPEENPVYEGAESPPVSEPLLKPDDWTVNVSAPVPSPTTSFCLVGWVYPYTPCSSTVTVPAKVEP